MEALMKMTLSQLIGGATGLLLILSTLIEVTPIKWNPISSFLGWIGKKTNKELMGEFASLNKRVDSLEQQVDDIQSKGSERNAVACRVRILRFGDEIRRKVRHSQDSFDQILSDMDEYDNYCLHHAEFKNNKTVMTQQMIREEYARCVAENGFL